MRSWRCGHPKTPENTRGAGYAGKEHGQCRECYAVRHRGANLEYFHSVTGMIARGRYLRRSQRQRLVTRIKELEATLAE